MLTVVVGLSEGPVVGLYVGKDVGSTVIVGAAVVGLTVGDGVVGLNDGDGVVGLAVGNNVGYSVIKLFADLPFRPLDNLGGVGDDVDDLSLDCFPADLELFASFVSFSSTKSSSSSSVGPLFFFLLLLLFGAALLDFPETIVSSVPSSSSTASSSSSCFASFLSFFFSFGTGGALLVLCAVAKPVSSPSCSGDDFFVSFSFTLLEE